jgi:hypothetical protein
MAESSSAFSSSSPFDTQSNTDLREHAAHRMKIARDLARLLSCGQFNDLSGADFFSACEVFDVLLDDGYKSLQALEVRDGC